MVARTTSRSASGPDPAAWLRTRLRCSWARFSGGMLGMLVLGLHDLGTLLATADVAAAMSVEGQLGTDDVFAEDLQALRPHPGQGSSAANLRALMAGSRIRESHRTEACTRVQDAYSLRCSP